MNELNYKIKNCSKKCTLQKIYSEWKIWKWPRVSQKFYNWVNLFHENFVLWNIAKKVNNPLLQAKTCSPVLKTFYNKKISPLLVDNTFVTDIKTKANIFKEYFASNVLPISSVFPINQRFLTQWRLTFLDFNEEEILKIIRHT